MSAPAFTAGPWLIHAKHRWIVPAEDAFAEPDDALPICQLRDPDERLTEDETLANGFLIAAAPELYEALTDCRKVFSGYAGIHRMKLANPELGESDRLGIDAKVARNDAMADMCERALAKARGAA